MANAVTSVGETFRHAEDDVHSDALEQMRPCMRRQHPPRTCVMFPGRLPGCSQPACRPRQRRQPRRAERKLNTCKPAPLVLLLLVASSAVVLNLEESLRERVVDELLKQWGVDALYCFQLLAIHEQEEVRP